MHRDGIGFLSEQGTCPEIGPLRKWICPFLCAVKTFPFSTTVTIDQSGENPSGYGFEPVAVSMYVNKLLWIFFP